MRRQPSASKPSRFSTNIRHGYRPAALAATLAVAVAGLSGCTQEVGPVGVAPAQTQSASGPENTMHLKATSVYVGPNRSYKRAREHGQVYVHDWQGNPVFDAVVTVEFSGCYEGKRNQPRYSQFTAVSENQLEGDDAGYAQLDGDEFKNDRYRFDHSMRIISVEHPTLTYDPSANDPEANEFMQNRPCGL